MAKKKIVKKEEDKKEKKVVNKKDTKKELKKDKNKKDEFDKLVEELEIEEADDFVEEVSNNNTYFDEDEEDTDIEEDEDYDDEDVSEYVSVSKSTDENNEVKVLKLLTCVALCISVVTLLISLVILNKVSNINSYFVEDDEAESEVSSEYDTSMFTELTEDEFIALFDEDYEDDEIRFVFSGRSTCSYCVAFLPYLQQSVEEYDYTLYYLDIDSVSKYDEIQDLDEILEENISYTPMVYAIKNGEVIDVNDGYTEYSTLTAFLEEYGVEAK